MSSHNITKEEVGLAVKILHRRSIRSWAHTIINPNTNRPISHSSIYSAINDGTPPWLVKKLARTVRKAKQKAPRVFEESLSLINQQSNKQIQQN